MTNKDIESKIKTAFDHAVPDVFDKILTRVEGSAALKLEPQEKSPASDATEAQPKQTEVPLTFTSKEAGDDVEIREEKKKKPWVFRSVLIALAAAAAIFIPVGITSYDSVNRIASVVSLDVNPSIEINVNKNRRVLSVVPMNDDAKDIVGTMNFAGTDLNVTINALLGSMISKGYLSEIANSILISVDNADPDEAHALQEQLMNEIDKILKSDTFSGAIISQTIKDDARLKELAEKYGITLSKAQLIEEIIASNAKLKFEDLVKLPINDLNLLKRGDVDGVISVGSASDSGYIGLETATMTALENAGLDKNKVTDLNVGMDFEDGKLVYEVDFKSDGTAYEYDIDAVSGKIVKGEREGQAKTAEPKKDTNNSTNNEQVSAQTQPATQAAPQPAPQPQTQPATQAPTQAPAPPPTTQAPPPPTTQAPPPTQAPAPADIGHGRAQSIALGHAGVSAGNTRDLRVERDDDDGRIVYDVEFKAGGYEYSYEIDGSTGNIIDFDRDEDD